MAQRRVVRECFKEEFKKQVTTVVRARRIEQSAEEAGVQSYLITGREKGGKDVEAAVLGLEAFVVAQL